MAGLRGRKGDLGGFGVPDLAYLDDVRVLAQHAPEGPAEGEGVGADLALVDDALVVAVHELYGVLDGDDVLVRRAVDEVYHRGEGRGLAAARRARYQDDAALLHGEAPDHVGQAQILEFRHPERDEPHDDGDGPALLERVYPEPAYPRHGVGEVRLAVPLELLDQPGRDDAVEHLRRVLRLQLLLVLYRREQAAHSHHGFDADLQVEVAPAHLRLPADQGVDARALYHVGVPFFSYGG